MAWNFPVTEKPTEIWYTGMEIDKLAGNCSIPVTSLFQYTDAKMTFSSFAVSRISLSMKFRSPVLETKIAQFSVFNVKQHSVICYSCDNLKQCHVSI